MLVCVMMLDLVLYRLVTRVQTTLRGSADDIGWLGKSPRFPPVEDGTQDFLNTLEQIG